MSKSAKKNVKGAKASKGTKVTKVAKVAAVTGPRKVRKTRKVSLAEVPDVIDQIIHRNQTPEQVTITIPKKRGPKVKVKHRKGEPGPAHPIKSQYGDPVGIMVAKRVDYGVDGKVITKAELEAAKANGGEAMVVDHSKVFIGAARCNVNAGDVFDAATGRAIAMEQIDQMVSGAAVTVAESLVPYLRPFRLRAQRYFKKPYAREEIEVVTPSARGREGFKEKMSFAEKQVQISLRKLEAANAARVLDAAALAKREARAKARAARVAQEAGVSSP